MIICLTMVKLNTTKVSNVMEVYIRLTLNNLFKDSTLRMVPKIQNKISQGNKELLLFILTAKMIPQMRLSRAKVRYFDNVFYRQSKISQKDDQLILTRMGIINNQ